MMRSWANALLLRLRRPYAVLGTLVFGVAVFAAVSPASAERLFYLPVLEAYESAALHIAPSGARAFAYGERHFSAKRPALYDLPAAQVFLRKALALDPSLVNVHHELARVYFVQGDFSGAMNEINTQIALHGTTTPNSYYVRGLIEGFRGMYVQAAADYKHFLDRSPRSWATANDYSWILLKLGRAEEAQEVAEGALSLHPENPWLLNTSAIASYELGDYTLAKERIVQASAAVERLRADEWLHSYPGNDPALANEGMAAFRGSVTMNVHMIELAAASGTVQSTVSYE